jgi:NADH dehydrogenase
MNKKRVVIVGAGFGGIAVARRLKSEEYDVTIIDKSNHHLFQPLLYQVATAALSPGDIATPIRSIFSKQKNIRVILGEVKSVDKEANCVTLENGRCLEFDYLVLAVGAQYNYFGNEDWPEAAPGLKTLQDSLKIRERILLSLESAERKDTAEERQPYLTFVTVGAGPTGVEMAGAIAEIAKRNMMRDFKNFSADETRIVLIEAGDRVLNGFDEKLSQNALSELQKMGVDVRLSSPVKDIRKDGVELEDEFIATPNIIWAAGVSASPMLSSLNEPMDRMGRVKVNQDMSIKGNENIFVIGDAAYFEDKNGEALPGIAPVAMQQGRYLAGVIKSGLPKMQRKPFSYTDKGTMATIGRAKAVADIKGLKLTGLPAWLLWSAIHVFFLIDFRNQFRVFAEWVYHYITFKRGVRLISRSVFEDTFKNGEEKQLPEAVEEDSTKVE